MKLKKPFFLHSYYPNGKYCDSGLVTEIQKSKNGYVMLIGPNLLQPIPRKYLRDEKSISEAKPL